MPTREQASTGVAQMANSHTCQPGSLRLLNWLMATFHVGNDGCYNPASRLSGGGPSWHVYGKAIDAAANWNDPAQKPRGDAVFGWCLQHMVELNLQQMIWGNQIWDVSYGGVRHYGGSDHFNHVHIAIGFAAAQNWKPSANPTAPPPPAPTPEDDMFRILEDDADHTIWLTNWLERRRVKSLQEAAAIIQAGVTGGAPVVPWPHPFIANIPVSK